MINSLSRQIATNFWAVLAVIFLFRFAFIWFSGLDLIGDESYYWDWSRRPDWCYYSKPPMVAWLIGALTWVFGDNMPAVRLGAVLLGTALLAVFYYTARAFYSQSAAIIALLLLLATPANSLNNLIMSIDPPVYLFWMASIYYLHAALFKEQKYAWCLAGIMTGLACLSKPVAIALPLLLLIYLIIQTEFRRCITREYLGYLVPVLFCFLPLLLWNSQHEWITFHHSQSHFIQAPGYNLAQRLSAFASFMGLQFLLLTPITLILLCTLSVSACLKFSAFTSKEHLLILLGPLPLLGIIGLSLIQKVQANWPMPFYFSGLILLSGRLAEGLWPQWRKPAILTGFFMVLITYSLPFSLRIMGLSNSVLDPTTRLRQWNTLASNINAVRHHVLANTSDAFLLVDDHRYLVSELAFYLPDHPEVFRFSESGKTESQYEIWPGPTHFIGKNGLILSRRNLQQMNQKMGKAFTELIPVDSVSALPESKNARHYNIYFAKNLKQWPIDSL